jgi:hypothetical protein
MVDQVRTSKSLVDLDNEMNRLVQQQAAQDSSGSGRGGRSLASFGFASGSPAFAVSGPGYSSGPSGGIFPGRGGAPRGAGNLTFNSLTTAGSAQATALDETWLENWQAQWDLAVQQENESRKRELIREWAALDSTSLMEAMRSDPNFSQEVSQVMSVEQFDQLIQDANQAPEGGATQSQVTGVSGGARGPLDSNLPAQPTQGGNVYSDTPGGTTRTNIGGSGPTFNPFAGLSDFMLDPNQDLAHYGNIPFTTENQAQAARDLLERISSGELIPMSVNQETKDLLGITDEQFQQASDSYYRNTQTDTADTTTTEETATDAATTGEGVTDTTTTEEVVTETLRDLVQDVDTNRGKIIELVLQDINVVKNENLTTPDLIKIYNVMRSSPQVSNRALQDISDLISEESGNRILVFQNEDGEEERVLWRDIDSVIDLGGDWTLVSTTNQNLFERARDFLGTLGGQAVSAAILAGIQGMLTPDQEDLLEEEAKIAQEAIDRGNENISAGVTGGTTLGDYYQTGGGTTTGGGTNVGPGINLGPGAGIGGEGGVNDNVIIDGPGIGGTVIGGPGTGGPTGGPGTGNPTGGPNQTPTGTTRNRILYDSYGNPVFSPTGGMNPQRIGSIPLKTFAPTNRKTLADHMANIEAERQKIYGRS